MSIPEIDIHATKKRLDAGDATVVDIRDPRSFRAAHIPGARRLDDANVRAFVRDADKSRTLIVCCYHGHSSLGAAAFFLHEGFADVYSMSGGFEAWRGTWPHETGEGA